MKMSRLSEIESNLPLWDMNVPYPGLESPEFELDIQATIQAVEELVALFDGHHISRQEKVALDRAVLETFEHILGQYNIIYDKVHTMRVYIESFVHTDSRYELAQTILSAFRLSLSQLSLLRTRLDGWIASLDLESLLEQSAVARDHAFILRKVQEQTVHQTSVAKETIDSKMSQRGKAISTSSWETIASQLTVKVVVDGEEREMTMSDVRKLAYHPDRDLRRRAYEAELAAWEQRAVLLAATLNSIKGKQILLAKERGWDSPLEDVLAKNNIDQQTLDALMTALHESFSDFQRYLQAKARLLGLPVLAWYDLNAPVAENAQSWPYARAKKFIIEQFGTYSSKMAMLAQRAFQEGWIDARPRAGKIDVSYCSHFRNDESRILVNYKPTFYEVTILAHELGHAYHNLNLAQRTALQRETPRTLAETSSTFCQTVVQMGGLKQASIQEQLTILDASLQFTTLAIVESTTWFLFEKAMCEKRERGELSVETLKQLMLDSQQQCYGDGLDTDARHPYVWAAWPHQYWYSFYNFQYAFGTLFALGLYRRYQENPEAFKMCYDDLLASTGMDDAAELAARFDIDIRSADFWRLSLDMIRGNIDRFETAVAQLAQDKLSMDGT